MKAKMEVFHNFPANGTAILNGDDDMLRSDGLPLTYIIMEPMIGLDYQAIDIGMTTDGNLQFRVLCRDGEYPLVSVLGRHNVYNSIAAITVGRLFGMSFQESGRPCWF